MKSIIWIMIVFTLNGCIKQPEIIVTCNKMPLPSKELVLKIQNLKDNELDLWMKNLLILKKQLEIDCNYKNKK